MWATDPIFGVGAGRYYGMSERFMGPFIRDLWRENAHNNFLQIGAELGALGLLGFLGLLIFWAASLVKYSAFQCMSVQASRRLRGAVEWGARQDRR